MSISSTTTLTPHLYRRTADITPASRIGTGVQNPPTSPKIHELRERYEGLQDKNSSSNSTEPLACSD